MWPFKKKEEKIKEEDEIYGMWYGSYPQYRNYSPEHPCQFGDGWMTEIDYRYVTVRREQENRESEYFESSYFDYTGSSYGLDLSRCLQTGKGIMTVNEARQMFLRDYKSADDVLQEEREVWKKYGRNMVETYPLTCEYCGSRFEAGQGWNCPQCGAPIKG